MTASRYPTRWPSRAPKRAAAFDREATRPDTDWRGLAACTGQENLHHPDGWDGRHAWQVQQAKAVCRRCPVEAQCLQWALTTDDHHAVLGGTTPDERRAMTRREAS